MSGKNEELVAFFRELFKVISKHDPQIIISKIKEIATDTRATVEKGICEQIIIICANYYSLEKDLIFSSKKRGIVSEARKMCFALMKKNLEISDSTIGHYVGGRSKQYVNSELKTINLEQEKLTTKYEMKFLADFVCLNDEVLRFKNSFKINENS